MTATPIPRTLQLISYHDMQVSSIKTKPIGRQPIETRTMSVQEIPNLLNRLPQLLAQKQKIYWICPLIESSEDDQRLMDVTRRFDAMRQIFGDKVGLLHGQMSADEKESALSDFLGTKTDILIATTVIEVGIHVPDATVMIIENAEKFGLSQLHQLRGRVGRGSLKSHCLLLFGTGITDTAKRRLALMRKSDDGFFLAEEDLKIRGGGDLIGTQQSGWPQFHCVDLLHHKHLMEMANTLASDIVSRNLHEHARLQLLLALFQRQGSSLVLHSG